MGNLRQIGGIQIFAEIYQGTATIVYKGYQPSLERFVLLKVLRPEFAEDEGLRKRFEEEARLIAKIQHPNVVAIYDFGREGQYSYFAAEFVEGYNLGDLLRTHEKIPPDIAWFILLETAKGLKAAHDKDIFHKDIKPTNILISHDGPVKITDFGLATLRSKEKNAEEEISGTLAYMSPEYILGEELNKNSDIFSLGATFYETLTGTPAFRGEKAGDYCNAIVNYDPITTLERNANIPSELTRICKKMMFKSQTQRYQNCDELIKDLEKFQSNYKLNVTSTHLKSYLQHPDSYQPKIEPPLVAEEKVENKVHHKALLLIALALVVGVIVAYFGIFNQNSQKELGEEVITDSQENSSQESLSSVKKQNSAAVLEQKELALKLPAKHSLNDNKTKKGTPEEGMFKEAESGSAPEIMNLEAASKESSETGRMGLGYLQITCTPWAVVYINGDSIGTTPFEEPLELQPGNYGVTFKHPEFPEYNSRIEIKDNEQTAIEISFWSLVGTLELEVSPWAEVYIDGEYKDTVPPQTRPFILRPGQHILTLKHPGLGEWSTTIDIVAERALKLRFNLRNLLSR